jgi:hypothetical protein
MSTASWLDFETCFDGTFDDGGYLRARLGVCYRGRLDGYGEVVDFDIFQFVEWIAWKGVELAVVAKSFLDRLN